MLDRSLGVGLEPRELAWMYLSRKCCSQGILVKCIDSPTGLISTRSTVGFSSNALCEEGGEKSIR